MNDKPRLPETVRALALTAKARTHKRRGTAVIADIVPSEEAAYLKSPFAEEDWELWAYLLLDTFGTRQLDVAHAFMRQLASMCPREWDGEAQKHKLDNPLFQTALSIVASLDVQNEAEAALAVQCVALHFATFKVTDYMGSRSWLDPKGAAALAAISKAYATNVRLLRDLHIPNRARRQVIKVQKIVQVNYTDARQVNVPGGGSGNSGNQPDATRAQRAHARPPGELVEVTALPSQNTGREVVPIPCGEGQEGLPNARRSKGQRSA